jgi:hypothetical protein
VKEGRLVVQRPAPGQALTLTVTGNANDGTVRVDATCDLGHNDSPWAAKAKVSGLDTSPLVTKQGAGRYLALVLPAIVPAEATTSVLSGRLDADLDLASQALSGPRAAPTLTGRGQVLMSQGSVKDSTLFGGLAGGGGTLSQLLKVVPGVGSAFSEWSKAVVFERLSSTFTIEREEIRLDPVVLVSQAMDLKFSGVVGFDGRMDLKVPLRVGGQAGQAMEPYVKDRTIPLRVRSAAGGKPQVTPELKMENLGKGLLDDVLRGLGK